MPFIVFHVHGSMPKFPHKSMADGIAPYGGSMATIIKENMKYIQNHTRKTAKHN